MGSDVSRTVAMQSQSGGRKIRLNINSAYAEYYQVGGKLSSGRDRLVNIELANQSRIDVCTLCAIVLYNRTSFFSVITALAVHNPFAQKCKSFSPQHIYFGFPGEWLLKK